jgi:FixJ family two-component response regulator
MPGMDGIELQRRVRLERPTLPVILISAHYNAEVRQTAIDEGVVDFLYKPFDATDLLKTIQSALTNSPNK